MKPNDGMAWLCYSKSGALEAISVDSKQVQSDIKNAVLETLRSGGRVQYVTIDEARSRSSEMYAVQP